MGSISYDGEPTIETSKTYGDWRDQLIEDGYVVIKGVVSEKNAKYYMDSMFEWLESFPFGFSREDKSTWGPQNLPAHMKGGMYHGYSVPHEKFYWKARQEPGVLSAFSHLWGTEKLLVSFDGANLTLPHPDRAPSTAWQHVDQSPLRKGLQCAQGIINLAPNGLRDGGLMVLKGSSKLNEEFFATHATDTRTWGPADWFGFTEDECKWFTDRGCVWEKVCVDPGDLILWDSRCMHYNVLPETDQVRSVLYVCYTPAAYASQENLAMKRDLFKKRVGTTHWPHANIFANGMGLERLGRPETFERTRPVNEPEETETVLRLAGVLPY